jgi:hypothetical protein
MEQIKKCIGCDADKLITRFDKGRNVCRDCRYKQRRQTQAEKQAEINAARRVDYEKNNAHINELRAINREENRDKINEQKRIWGANNKDKISAYNKKYGAEHRAELSEKYKEYYLERKQTDPAFNILCNSRTRIRDALKGKNKSAKTVELLGCTPEYLKTWLEGQWYDDKMNWENYGTYWHIDHIIPCSSFDLTDPEQQKECFNYMNLQPMIATENLQKGNKIMGV